MLAAAVFLASQDGPHAVTSLPPPTKQDAQHMRAVVLGLEHIDRQPDRSGDLGGTLEEWNGLLRILARSQPALAGQVTLEDGGLALAATLRLPGDIWPGRLTLRVLMPPSDSDPRPSAIRIGSLPLPPQATLWVASRVADLRFGPGSGEATLAMLKGFDIDGDRVRFDVVLPDGTEGRVSRTLLAEAVGSHLPDREDVVAYVDAFERLAEAGTLPRNGSFLPWIQATLDLAIEKADPDDPGRTLLAAFLALDRLCGSGTLARILPTDEETGRREIRSPRICGSASLHNRPDLRQHFVTAGTIRLLSNRGVAVTAGETKELSDFESTGFDFTDIAGNNSGIRFVSRLAATPPEEWPEIRAMIQQETDIIIPLHGVPGGLSPAAFRLRFGTVDSPEYRAMLDEIEARIDRLPIHARPPAPGQEG